MLRVTVRRCCSSGPLAGASFAGIREGRQVLSQQFASMDGWQRGEDARFDDYVDQKRQKDQFEALDQRVERAFRISAKLHKTEIINGFKRKLVSASGKFSPTVMREMHMAIEERTEWLRDVFAQIDADYRSGDKARQQKAAHEISEAIKGNPSDYMTYVYEQKRERRFLGEKGAAAMDAELEAGEMPAVTDDEANRYHSLKTNMLELERNVKGKFGVAGQRHWAQLQREKDEEYDQKLDAAVDKYKELLTQDERYAAMRATLNSRNALERRHLAQVRFKGAMELEKERERLIDAHKQMEAERSEARKARARAALLDVARMRREGKTSHEIIELVNQSKLEASIARQDTYRQQERTDVTAKRAKFLDLIEKLHSTFEARDGARAMQQQQQQQQGGGTDGFGEQSAQLIFNTRQERPRPLVLGELPRQTGPRAPPSPFAFPDDDAAAASPDTEEADLTVLHAADAVARKTTGRSGLDAASAPRAATDTELAMARRQALWQLVHQDTHEDPFLTVHQARLHAAQTQSEIYAKQNPVNFAMGSKKVSRQGDGSQNGAAMERFILKDPEKYTMTASFAHDAFNTDVDPTVQYGFSGNIGLSIRDPKTWEPDHRFVTRAGMPALRGPRFYKMGEEREKQDPANWPIHASPKKAGVAIQALPSRSE